MMGEELNASVVTERGLFGDRAYAIMDKATGKVASAKHPRKWKNFSYCKSWRASARRTCRKAFPPTQNTELSRKLSPL
jgi:uncharacterized protein YcbX